MMVAMTYVMITEHLEDREFLDKYTVGFGKFADYVLGREDGVPKTPGWASQVTGVSVDNIVNLSREYARTTSAALMNGYAPARTAFGEQADRSAVALAAMTGNIGVVGGSSGIGTMVGLQRVSGPRFICTRMKGGDNPLDLTAPMRKGSFLSEARNAGEGLYQCNQMVWRRAKHIVPEPRAPGRCPS